MAKKALIPPDLNRCQAEKCNGSFMTLGPRKTVRCTAEPTWIATEPKQKGRKRGSMSLCDSCKAVCEKQVKGVTFKRSKTFRAQIQVTKAYNVDIHAENADEAINKANAMQSTEIAKKGTLIDVETSFVDFKD